MSRYLVDGKAPGQFKAVCNLVRAHVITELPHYLRREYEEKGWPKGYRSIYSRKHRTYLNAECYLEPLCEGFETTDPVAFEQHMAELHGKKPRGPRRHVQGRGMWNGPRLKPEGQPFVDKDERTSVCPDCGTVVEITAASALPEHGCPAAEQVAS